jgi:DNA polymerase III psi subunit
MPRDTLIQIRRGTLAQWLSTNPTLANGEVGFITDQCRLVVVKTKLILVAYGIQTLV